MKKKILFFVFIVIASISILNFYNPPSMKSAFSAPPQSGSSDKFLVGCIQSAPATYNYYDEMGINFAHSYIGTENKAPFPKDPNRHTPKGWVTTSTNEDHLTSPVPTDKIREVLNNMYSHNHSRNI